MAAPARQPAASTTAPPASSGRSRALDLAVRFGPFAVLAAWTAVVAGLLMHFSIDNHYVFTDEVNAVLLGRFMEDDLFARLFEGNVARGPERMTSWLAALAATVTTDTTEQYELLHAVNSLVQALIVVPVWLAARQLGMSRWFALVPATIATAGCFAYYGILTLNTAVGGMACALLLWGMLRSLRRPGFVSDLVVTVALGLTVLARIGWAPLVGALIPATLATIWFGRPAGERVLAWLKSLPLRLLRRHPLLAALAAVFLLALLRVGLDPLIGGSLYGGVRVRPSIELPMLWDNTKILLSHLAIGTALVPLMLAIPVLLRGLVRPTDAVEGGFAWLLIGYLAIFSYAYYLSLNEDRYMAVLAPPLVLMGALAVARRPPPWWSVALSGVGVTWLVASSYRWPVIDIFSYFTAPTSRFFGDLLLGRLTTIVSVSRELLAVFILGVAALVAVGVVLLVKRRPPLRILGGAAAVTIAGLLLFQLAGTYHPASKFTEGLALDYLTPEELEFVDEAVTANGGQRDFLGRAEPQATDGGVRADIAAQMPFLQAFNSSLGYGFRIERDGGAPSPEVPVPHVVSVNWRTGDVTVGGPIPEVLLTSAGQETVGFDSQPLPGDPNYGWAELERLHSPLVAEWMIRDDLLDRYADPDRPLRVRVYPHGDQRCLRGLVNQHPLSDRRVRYRIEGGVNTPRGIVNPGTPIPFRVRLRGDRPTTLVVHGRSGRLPDGTLRAPSVFSLVLEECRG